MWCYVVQKDMGELGDIRNIGCPLKSMPLANIMITP